MVAVINDKKVTAEDLDNMSYGDASYLSEVIALQVGDIFK